MLSPRHNLLHIPQSQFICNTEGNHLSLEYIHDFGFSLHHLTPGKCCPNLAEEDTDCGVLSTKHTCWTKLYMHISHGKYFLFPWASVSSSARDLEPFIFSKHRIWHLQIALTFTHIHTCQKKIWLLPTKQSWILLVHSLKKFLKKDSMQV